MTTFSVSIALHRALRSFASLHVIQRAFELAGVELIDGNGGGPGVRLRKPERPGPKIAD